LKNVRGSLFVDYVRLIRSRKDIDWSRYLEAKDFAFLQGRVDDAAWYPIATYERFGVGILSAVAGNSLATVRMWGQFQVDAMLRQRPDILEAGDPRESLMRVVVHRKGFFDYDVLTVKEILDDHARFELNYAMSGVAELAACSQTLGALEELARRAGGRNVKAAFSQRTWEGDPCTILEITWS
jgi:hypothetical protein